MNFVFWDQSSWKSYTVGCIDERKVKIMLLLVHLQKVNTSFWMNMESSVLRLNLTFCVMVLQYIKKIVTPSDRKDPIVEEVIRILICIIES